MEGLILRDGGRFTTPYTLHTCLLAATLARPARASDPCLRTALCGYGTVGSASGYAYGATEEFL